MSIDRRIATLPHSARIMVLPVSIELSLPAMLSRLISISNIPYTYTAQSVTTKKLRTTINVDTKRLQSVNPGGKVDAMSTECLIALRRENVDLLEQLRALLNTLTPEQYQYARQPFERGGIGKHVRHVLDHYTACLESTDAAVDYESRVRDLDLETDPIVAADACSRVCSILSDYGSPISVGSVRYTWGTGACDMETSPGRELHFLSSHTVHHMALISFILRSMDSPVPQDFGVAFSTLRFEAGSR